MIQWETLGDEYSKCLNLSTCWQPLLNEYHTDEVRQEAAVVKRTDTVTAFRFSFFYDFSYILEIAGAPSFQFVADLA